MLSGFVEFKLNLAEANSLAIGDVLLSDDFLSGGHVWRVRCYPHGHKAADNDGLHLSVYLRLVSKSKNVKAIFDAFLMRSDGAPSASHAQRFVQVYPPEGFEAWGSAQFVKRADLESSKYVKDGHVTFMFGVIVLRGDDDEDHIAVPPSDMGDHLGRLLDAADGSDVSFDVGGETFPAHRAVLAARSPVFKAQLLGSMAEAKMSCITLHGIKPATFQILLRFMYTDKLPKDKELEQSSSTAIEVFQNLLAAADMFQLDRLKLMCAHKLWERVTVENVATVLVCAETHSCPELKNRCIGFFAVDTNLKQIMFTDGYRWLMQEFPSLVAELKTRVHMKT